MQLQRPVRHEELEPGAERPTQWKAGPQSWLDVVGICGTPRDLVKLFEAFVWARLQSSSCHEEPQIRNEGAF